MQASGVSGELKAGYQRMARLGRWQFSTDESGGWTATAEVVEADAYWMAHADIVTLLLDMGARRWRWQGVRVSGEGTLVIHGEGAPTVV